ncbi:hypothetical protein YN1_3860 [Nanoarchaeota archaeon]
MFRKRSDTSTDFLVYVVLFIVALLIVVAFMVFYFHGGVNLFKSVKPANGSVIVNDVQNNNYNP